MSMSSSNKMYLIRHSIHVSHHNLLLCVPGGLLSAEIGVVDLGTSRGLSHANFGRLSLDTRFLFPPSLITTMSLWLLDTEDLREEALLESRLADRYLVPGFPPDLL